VLFLNCFKQKFFNGTKKLLKLKVLSEKDFFFVGPCNFLESFEVSKEGS